MHALDSLFNPRSVAIVGATEKAMWTGAILRNFPAYNFQGELYAVNRQGVDVLGVKGYSSCAAIGKPVDAAYIIVPVTAIREAIADVIAAGIKNAVLLTSGFSEIGASGTVLQDEIVAQARSGGLRFLGPNSLGFVNFADRKPLTAMPPQPTRLDGKVGLISQSGATTSELMDIARRVGVGLSFATATGNEAMLGIADVMDYLVDHEPTRVIAVYSEAIRDPDEFSAAARRAAQAGKSIVMIKVGSSALSGAVAAAHTGALVGDDRVFEAVCKRLNIIRVRTVEDLIITSGFMAQCGELKRSGVAMVSISGGACAMSTDIAESLGVEFPRFSPQTQAALRQILPAYASTLNPFDVTGAAMADPTLFEKSISIIDKDPAVGCLFAVYPLPDDDAPSVGGPQLAGIGAGLNAAANPGFLLTQGIQPVNEFGRKALNEAGIERVMTGIEASLRAVAGAVKWAEQHRSRRLGSDAQPIGIPSRAAGSAAVSLRDGGASAARVRPSYPRGERATLEYLAGFDVPIIPAVLAKSASEAGRAAEILGASVVLKVASPDIAHKSDIGGVRLDVRGSDAAAAAYQEILRAASTAAPRARIDGVVVSPMRKGGLELFAGVTRDAQWGWVLAVGLGGIWVEALNDSALALLPVTRDVVRELLLSLKGVQLLHGFRGSAPADLEELARVICAIADAAESFGPDLAALEVNPLLAYDGKVEALDALLVWSESMHGA